MHNQSKQILRERILTLLRNQKEEERLVKSAVICGKLFQLEEFRKAETILFYASFNGEVETFAMMNEAQKQGKTIGLPGLRRMDRHIIPLAVASLVSDLETGPYGIQQPKMDQARTLDTDQIDLVVVPGVAFDRHNNRLGRGGGYYDRFLERLPSGVPTVGLAFDFQLVDALPFQESHDHPVSRVLTN